MQSHHQIDNENPQLGDEKTDKHMSPFVLQPQVFVVMNFNRFISILTTGLNLK